jgi:hypothetical protein
MHQTRDVTLTMPDYLWDILETLSERNYGSIDKEVQVRLMASLARYLNEEMVPSLDEPAVPGGKAL